MWLSWCVSLLFTMSPPPRPAASVPARVSSQQPPTVHALLIAEHARSGDARVFDAAIASGDTVLQRVAARALGRIEREGDAPRILPLMRSPAATVRREAINAIGQMRAPFDYATMLLSESDGIVRGAIFETLGRSTALSSMIGEVPGLFRALAKGLAEDDLATRRGAARGLESLIRRTARSARPTAETVTALRTALVLNTDAEMRQLLLLALTAAGERDPATFASALMDTSALVRRLAVAASRQWRDDVSPMVRYQALKSAGTCERALAALRDVNEHVVLAAIEVLGEKQCGLQPLDSLVRAGRNWRVQTRALLALTRVDSVRARAALPRLAQSPVWQARAWVANAARALKDSPTLTRLAADPAPNVAIAAMSSDADALRALNSTHAGLALAGATFLKTSPRLASYTPALVKSLQQLTTQRRATNRDPRQALLQRLHEVADSATARQLEPWTRDLDPVIATLAATVISDRAHIPTTAVTTTYVPLPFPSAATLASLRGATAEIRVKQLGTIVIALLPDDAPATVATFVERAEAGAFNNLTWHRIVPNFVLQGGSPGADEYDGLTSTFMRDEVGFARHARGTFGISTRGRDTGDGQLFINLVDNFRLDHDYTVFATMRRGADVMDRIQEGDIIESISITRTTTRAR
ncbi:MAG: peptidylprolyl isomerase [Gemmatimonadaceae bacterium]|nr:peptidylprolyl isomerase [Gemmatimonadaceae bacterium]